jgi:hypothetical protein
VRDEEEVRRRRKRTGLEAWQLYSSGPIDVAFAVGAPTEAQDTPGYIVWVSISFNNMQSLKNLFKDKRCNRCECGRWRSEMCLLIRYLWTL